MVAKRAIGINVDRPGHRREESACDTIWRGGQFFSWKERNLLKSIHDLLDRILHADCALALPALPKESIDLVVTDPPYLVNYVPRDGRRCVGDNADYWLKPAFCELFR